MGSHQKTLKETVEQISIDHIIMSTMSFARGSSTFRMESNKHNSFIFQRLKKQDRELLNSQFDISSL